jgi:protein-tyrosine phosphatase
VGTIEYNQHMTSLLFVCTGNICRSPTAEGVLRERAQAAGLSLTLDSAGTHGYHIGEAPDPRTIAHAKKRGYDLSTLRARRVEQQDFDRFDWILALDHSHLDQLRALQPKNSRAQVRLLLDERDVPDPYYGNAQHFEHVLDLTEEAADAWIAQLTTTT